MIRYHLPDLLQCMEKEASCHFTGFLLSKYLSVALHSELAIQMHKLMSNFPAYLSSCLCRSKTQDLVSLKAEH